MADANDQVSVPTTDAEDIRSIVAAAYAEPKPDTESQPSVSPPADPAAPAEGEPTSARPRNERGQFIKADGSVDTEAEAAKPVPDADPIPDKPAQPIAGEPPKSWSAETKAEWSKLSPAVQQAVLKRESEINEGGRRWSEEKRAYDTAIVNPIKERATRAGVSVQEGLNRLLEASDYLEHDPENAIRSLAQAYGVDLSQAPSNPQSRPPADPRYAELASTVNELKSQLATREQTEVRTVLSDFAKTHPHFDAVSVTMGKLMKSGMVAEGDLDAAYDMATHALPDVRELVMAPRVDPSIAKRQAEQATAANARRAAISITGSPAGNGAAAARPEFNTVEDAVRDAWRRHAGNA